jgi:hypothetical protein
MGMRKDFSKSPAFKVFEEVVKKGREMANPPMTVAISDNSVIQKIESAVHSENKKERNN